MHRWNSLGLIGACAFGMGCSQSEQPSTPVQEELSIAQAKNSSSVDPSLIGQEVAVPRHLADGEEYQISLRRLLRHGQRLFEAVWTVEEGGGRPFTNGVGGPLNDPTQPLVFPRANNRISAPDSNSCSGCHNQPASGGGGDIVANVFVTGQRFDFLTFDSTDDMAGRGAMMENGELATLQSVAANRNTVGMFGSGYVEMLARQMTEELQAIRDQLQPSASAPLVAKGIHFGFLGRHLDGTWDLSGVVGLTPMSLGDGSTLPSLVIRPFHQASAVVSLREFSNNAFNHHHGMQSTERFGVDTDPDGDGFVNELSRADLTAVSVWQAALPVPGRVIPRHPAYEQAVLRGEELFESLGCVTCHTPSLPLEDRGWVYSEPNPYNPNGNLQPDDAPAYEVNLNNWRLPWPRLRTRRGVTEVPAYTDLRLHDITCGPEDPNREPVNMHYSPSDSEFFEGNSRFVTRKLWGVASEPPYFHHGQYTTLRRAVEAHCGEALESGSGFASLGDDDKNALIEFLKSLRILPSPSLFRIVDENGFPRAWRGRLR